MPPQRVLAGRTGITTPIPMSIPWSRDKDRYIEGLRRFQAGVADGWIEFSCSSIVEAIDWTHTTEQRVASLLTDMAERSRTRGGSATSRIIRDLPVHPRVDTGSVAARYGITRQAAHEALRRLSEDGILTERSFSKRAKGGRLRQVFSSPELIDLLSGIISE
ncbi:MAG: hypothetical protein BMS9Abin20_0910 [Acidimicrobiia bacterium]|nr:MAG: hypothetical protein BMS9Abin20_0910 [Acidimicrobiia bacterium]